MAHPSVESVFLCRLCCMCVCMRVVSVCVGVEQKACLQGQRGWQVWRFRLSAPGFSLWPLQVSPEPQSQRWKISKLWAPFLRWRVQTCPSVSTGLQIRDQKCRAQQSPSRQSEDLRHVSPSPPDRQQTEQTSDQHSETCWRRAACGESRRHWMRPDGKEKRD